MNNYFSAKLPFETSLNIGVFYKLKNSDFIQMISIFKQMSNSLYLLTLSSWHSFKNGKKETVYDNETEIDENSGCFMLSLQKSASHFSRRFSEDNENS